MKYIKTYEGQIPKFKIGDEVIVQYDLTKFGYPYGIVKGDLVTIIDYWINANGDISYKIDSPKIREIKKGVDTSGDDFSEFYFEYEFVIASKNYDL